MFRQSIDADEIDQVPLARRSTERLKMAAERALCTNADCHHDLSGCSQPPSFALSAPHQLSQSAPPAKRPSQKPKIRGRTYVRNVASGCAFTSTKLTME